MHQLYFPLVKLASLNVLGFSIDGLIKKARGSMDLLMITDFVGAAVGANPRDFRKMVISGSGVTDEVLDAMEYEKNPGSFEEKPPFYEYLEQNKALNWLEYLQPKNLGLYNSMYGGASKGLDKVWRPEYSEVVPGIRGASPDDILQAMLFGGIPLPGGIWDNTQNKYKARSPLYAEGDNIMIRLGKNSSKYKDLAKIKGALSRAAERTALKWVISVDQGYKGNFVSEDVISDLYKDVDPLSPEELLEFEGWFDLVIPKARFNLRNSEGQLRLFNTVVDMRDSGKDPLIYKGGRKPDVGLRIKEVINWMESKGMVGPSGNAPSSPRIAKAWKGVKKAILDGFGEVFSVVQQDLVEEEREQMERALMKHDLEEVIESRKSLRTQILENFIEEQRRRRKSADLKKKVAYLSKKLVESMSLPQAKRASVSVRIASEISKLEEKIQSL